MLVTPTRDYATKLHQAYDLWSRGLSPSLFIKRLQRLDYNDLSMI